MRRPWFDAAAPRVIVLVVLFAAAGFYESVHQHSLNNLANGDFWWHLRVGIGIVENHALPHSGLYSQASALPWMPSSWLYDILIAAGYRAADLHIVPLLAMACKTALAVVTFVLAGGLRGRFWPAVALSAIAQCVLVNLQPLPLYCSVLLFAVELLLLMDCRRTASARALYWLPLLFLLWSNLDAQFVVGIFALLLFAAVILIETWGARAGIGWLERSAEPPLNMIGAATAAALLATFLTPYGWNMYGVFFARMTSAANSYFPDFQALRFRSPQDYVLLVLVAAGFLALGMRHSRDLFQIALLLLCTFASFRAQRDVWLGTLAGLAILADALPGATLSAGEESSRSSVAQLLSAAGLACLLLTAAAAIHLPRGRKAMLAEIGEGYPVAAADYIREHHLPQPLFNAFPWGGFLTWYLPEYPVAIDGRTELYGDEFNIEYAKVMNAEAHFSTFPALSAAGTLLLQKSSLMATALATVPGFNVAYSDNVAVVLVREQPVP